MSESDISELVRQNLSNLYNAIQDYTNLNSIYNEFKTGKQFECTNVEYSNSNGRIVSMTYEEI